MSVYAVICILHVQYMLYIHVCVCVCLCVLSYCVYANRTQAKRMFTILIFMQFLGKIVTCYIKIFPECKFSCIG